MRTIAFVLPFTKMVSNYVRALSLRDYEPHDWQFVFIEGDYPRIFNFFILRTIYRYLFYLTALSKLNKGSSAVVTYFIKPGSPVLLWLVRHVLKMRVMLDVNDPYHLPELLGVKTTTALFKNADRLVFESKEYCEYWAPNYSKISTIVSDTPQHECIYTNFRNRSRSFIWIGSPHTAPYILTFMDYFKVVRKHGYSLRFLGASEKILELFRTSGIDFTVVEQYDNQVLANELESSFASFVPMPKDDLFQLRGNLKAKVSMGFGCLTVASRMPMHESLITHGVTGYLFDNLQEFEQILAEIADVPASSKIAREGNKFVAETYSRGNQAMKLIEAAESLSER